MTKFEDAVKALADQRREHFLTCKPSELILLALEDLEKVEGMPKVYRVDMGVFHIPNYSGEDRCAVCLGGAVLAQTIKLDPGFLWHGDDDEADPITQRIFALDMFRNGAIELGFEVMKLPLPYNVRRTVEMAQYRRDPIEFKSGLRWIAKHLAERGL